MHTYCVRMRVADGYAFKTYPSLGGAWLLSFDHNISPGQHMRSGVAQRNHLPANIPHIFKKTSAKVLSNNRGVNTCSQDES